MTEINSSDTMSVDATTPASPTPIVADTVPVASTEDTRLKKLQEEVAAFKPPKHFIFVMPNLMRGIVTDFKSAMNDPDVDASKKTKELATMEKTIEEQLAKLKSSHAVFFSAKEVKVVTADMGDWLPLSVPAMVGRAKIVLIHKDTWAALDGYSFVVRHHPSYDTGGFSEVHEIYVMTQQGAQLEYVSELECVACKVKPAPFQCTACGANYCTPICQNANREAHQIECITNITKNMKLTLENRRTELNKKAEAFRAEQAEFARRNAGKLVTVRRINADGETVETEEVVVPAAENSK
jgi:hypothetical protein